MFQLTANNHEEYPQSTSYTQQLLHSGRTGEKNEKNLTTEDTENTESNRIEMDKDRLRRSAI